MALNLNKDDENNSKPSLEKKGLNLNKSEDNNSTTEKKGLNLNKSEDIISKPSLEKNELNLNKSEDIISKPSSEKNELNLNKSDDNSNPKKKELDYNISKNTEKDNTVSNLNEKQKNEKKKSPIVLIFSIIIFLGVVIYWFNSKDTKVENSIKTSKDKDSNVNTLVKENVDENNQNVDSSRSNENQPISTLENNNQNSTADTSYDIPKKSSNSSMSSPEINQLEGTIEEKANKVIAGEFGNGLDRKNALGSEYVIIQAKVNELYRTLNYK